MDDASAWGESPDLSPEYGRRAEAARRGLARASATVSTLIAETLHEAREAPWEWIPCPVGDTSPEKRDHAERAAVMDLASRLRMSEFAVRSHGDLALRAPRRLPSLWAAFTGEGTVSLQHLRAALEVSEHLDEGASLTFDRKILPLALDLPPGRMRTRGKLIAERLHRRPLDDRHRDAVAGRNVRIDPAEDGMAYLTAYLSGETAARISARLDTTARHLAETEGETRTREQLRADVLSDLLTGDGTAHAVKTTVHLEVPVMSLLGQSDRPAVLDGTVPVAPSVARRLCATGSVLFRVLTDPVTSAVIDLDRRSYRPTADLARYVHVRDKVCARPGCSRPARRCDLDHTLPWARGGHTDASNLAPLCAPHHRAKHETRWRVTGTHGRLTWTSPTGFAMGPEPPDG